MQKGKELLEKIKLLIEIEAKKKNTNLSSISIQIGKNEKYLSNKFNKNSTISVDTLYEVANVLECEPSIFLPSIQEC